MWDPLAVENVTERDGQMVRHRRRWDARVARKHIGTLLVNLKDLLLPLQFGFALSLQTLAYEIQFDAPPR